MSGDWKQQHADEAEQLAQHESVESVIEEFCRNHHLDRDDVWVRLSFMKLVGTVASIVLARARGIDPDTLRMTRDEAEEERA